MPLTIFAYFITHEMSKPATSSVGESDITLILLICSNDDIQAAKHLLVRGGLKSRSFVDNLGGWLNSHE